LLECLVDLRIASLIAFKNALHKSTLVSISHKAPSAVTRCQNHSLCEDTNKRFEVRKAPYKA
jgi:hypothetical protein